jgi:excinuclease ABC subunit A
MAKASRRCSRIKSLDASMPRNNKSSRQGQRQPIEAEGPPRGPTADKTAWLTVRGARHNNLRNIDVGFPLGRFTCVTGVSGSGKSSLLNDILYRALARELNRATTLEPGEHDGIDGLEHLDKVIAIDQSPIGRTPRSNPVTYIKVFDEIRALFAKLPDSKLRGYKPGRFSFNVHTGGRGGGRCEACQGNGANRIEMDFLSDVWVRCPVCEGKRFGRETLQIQYKHKSIADVLEMDVQQALLHFDNIPRTRSMLQTLHDVGLDYIKLGQPSTTLSGGEAQRIKLARELVKRPTGRTLYVLDEPTTGLHFDDIRKLLNVLHGFVDAGNTVIVIEHNLDVLKTADWIIDLGPEGGEEGGGIVVEGTPEEVAACAASYTGQALRDVLGHVSAKCRMKNAEQEKRTPAGQRHSELGILHSEFCTDSITVVGARQHNLKDLTVSLPRERTTVCTGVSGSGKTSFAIDTVFNEGYRRYVESLSAYARQFLGQMTKPKVDHVEGLSPAICIEQKAASKNPRSTVGTITEVYDYLRVLWARIGTPYCPRCQVPIGTQTVDEICDRVMALEAGSPIIILAPVTLGEGETYAGLFNRLRSSGYTRVRTDGQIVRTTHATTLDPRRKHRVEVVVDRTVVKRGRSRASPDNRSRIGESVEHALALGNGVMTLLVEEVERVHEDSDEGTQGRSGREARTVPQIVRTPEREFMFSQKLACTGCGTSYEELSPQHFGFNSQLGWCETCEGLGVQRGAPAAAIIKYPQRSLLKGAIAGWPHIEPRSPMGRLLTALCERLGVGVNAPLTTWTAKQKQVLMFGTEGAASFSPRGAATSDWIDAGGAFPSSVPSSLRASMPSVRFHWRGFFPTIDTATRYSWSLRHRLHSAVTDIPCATCRGGRLRPDAAAVRVGDKTVVEVCEMPLAQCATFFKKLRLDKRQRQIAGELLKEIRNRLQFLIDVGLEYLTLHRAAPTLAGGEAQRIRLASQVGSGLCGVLYVLDEPTIGLHPRDTRRLIDALNKLRNLGNTLLLVEHDRDVIRSADRILDFGPRAGSAGGEIVAHGRPPDFLKRVARPCVTANSTVLGAATRTADTAVPPPDKVPASLTRAYLSGETAIPIPSNRRPVEPWKGDGEGTEGRRGTAPPRRPDDPVRDWLVVRGARQNNLKDITVPLPLGRFICVTGVSGSGKSSLVNDILWPALARAKNYANLTPGEYDQIDGLRQLDKVINVDQSPIGNTPSSNPATYTGTFDWIRELFARLPDSKVRGFDAGRFSFNRPAGRCEACQGYGQKRIEMHFMPDVWVECETCGGKRYSPETLEIRFKGKNIADVLEMSVADALELFKNVPRVRRMLQTLADVGLDYVQLGQPAPTLSGGEAQRVKLAAELGKPDTGRTFYILDEPTTGLHFDDIHKLLAVIHRLVDLGNTVLVVEHNLDVIKCADWVIDLGPEAGDAGGYIVAMGTPERIASSELRVASSELGRMTGAVRDREKDIHADSELATLNSQLATSHTGVALKPILKGSPYETGKRYDPAAHAAHEMEVEKAGFGRIGRETKMPWQVDGRKWHLEQRTSREAGPTRWESAALEYVEELIQGVGRASCPPSFAPTNWNNRASVEITAPGAEKWFLHALTGGEWTLDLYFRVPRGTFKWHKLDAQLGLKTFDERDDLPTYGDWSRVDVRRRRDGLDAIAVYVHDKTEIDTPGFRRFIKHAAAAYLKSQGIEQKATKRRRSAAARPDKR